jgi:hypothetical protein
MEKQMRPTHEYQQPNRSRSYILRLWCADEPQAAEWHASLEDPSTRERFGFSSLEQVFAFLMEQSERDSGLDCRISGTGKRVDEKDHTDCGEMLR